MLLIIFFYSSLTSLVCYGYVSESMFSSNSFIVSDACAYIVRSADCNRTNYEISVIPRCLQKQGKWNRRIKKHTLSNTNIHEHRLCDYIILHIEILPSCIVYISLSVCACVCVCACAHTWACECTCLFHSLVTLKLCLKDIQVFAKCEYVTIMSLE